MSSAIKPKRRLYQYRTAAGSQSLLAAVSLTAAEASRTLVLQTGAPPDSQEFGGFDVITIGVAFTYSAATAVVATTYGSLDGGITYKALQSSSISAGVDTLSDYIASKAVSANKEYAFTLFNDNYTHIKVVFSGTGAVAGDLITVQATAGCK